MEGVASPRRLLGRRSRLHASLALGAALGASLLLASVGRAEVVESGSNNLPMYIGYQADGAVTVNAGSQINGSTTYVGYASEVTGALTVTGAGSAWINDGGLYFGYDGSGSLTVSDGARVSSLSGHVGRFRDTTGTALVTGAGSVWSNSESLYVAGYGTGSLTVSDGGKVTAGTLYASLSDLSGNGTIDVKGLVSDVDLVFDSTHGKEALLAFGAGGMLRLTLDGTGGLGVGYKGQGNLRIADGLTITSTTGYLGYASGSIGTAIVTGSGSTWTNAGSLYVGNNGSGSLTVSDGGKVTAGTLYASLSDLSGDGTITVKGLVSDADLVFDSTHGTEALLAFGAGGTLRLNHDGISSLGVGFNGQGSLRIADGRTIASIDGFVGYNNTDGIATATVVGAGSKWTNAGWLQVGYYGNGSLTVSDGAQVSHSRGYVGFGTNSVGTATVTGAGSTWTSTDSLYVGDRGNGSLTVSDGARVSNSHATVGSGFGTVGAVTVVGAGSAWTNSGSLTIGNSGTGSLTVSNGAQVSDSNGYLGYNAIATGTATVTGTGSKWTHSGSLYVGYNGSGSLTVSDEGLVTARTLYASLRNLSGNGTISANSGLLDADLAFDSAHAPGTPTAFGAGGALYLALDGTGDLGVGYKGQGSLRIADGLAIASTTIYLGYNSGSIGMATVTGSGSKWTSTETIYVGYNGNGSLTVSDGALVSNNNDYTGYLGYNKGSSGSATVTGVGSAWTTNGQMYIGRSGTGSLTIRDGAQVSDSSGHLGYNANSIGTVSVTGAGSTWTNSDTVYIGNSGHGSLTVGDGGVVSARSLQVKTSASSLVLHVTGDGMIVLGNATSNGSLTNNGKIKLYADADLAAGTYQPISPYSGKTIAWSGSGSYTAFGGTWNSTAKTFTVGEVIPVTAGTAQSIASGQRLDIRTADLRDSVGVSFGTVAPGVTFSARPMDAAELSLLAAQVPDHSPVAAWNFSTTAPTLPALLTFDVGEELSDLSVWHFADGIWSAYTPDFMENLRGVLSFTVNDFSGYAVLGPLVPEPTSLLLLAFGMPLLVRRRSCR